MSRVGWNDGAYVYCGQCDWKKLTRTDEQSEHYLKQHLTQVHSMTIYYRIEHPTGRKVEIPR